MKQIFSLIMVLMIGFGLPASGAANRQTRLVSSTTIDSQLYLPIIYRAPGDREALIALYNSTHGENWTDNTDWNTSSHYCNWYGVTCDSENRVTNLLLGSNNLYGMIPPAIGYLTGLLSLDLHSNELYGPLPPAIGNLVNLQYLDLSVIGLTSLPAAIGNLVNLQLLNLSENQLTSIPAEIGSLVNLEYLDLYNNQLNSLPAEIGNLMNLQDLDLAFNNLAGSIPVEIGSLGNLERLDLSSNTLSGPIPAVLQNLSFIYYLNLIANPDLYCWETQAALDWALGVYEYYGPAEVCQGW